MFQLQNNRQIGFKIHQYSASPNTKALFVYYASVLCKLLWAVS